jgi:hypothetical protein
MGGAVIIPLRVLHRVLDFCRALGGRQARSDRPSNRGRFGSLGGHFGGYCRLD